MDQHSGQGESDFQATDTEKQFGYKSGISGKLAFERVNEVTWKLTDGTMTNVPASHGQWGGYRVTKTVAWVIDVGPHKPAWIARYKDRCTNPTDLREAKVAAMAMAKGAYGDYAVSNPIAHLNGLTALSENKRPDTRGKPTMEITDAGPNQPGPGGPNPVPGYDHSTMSGPAPESRLQGVPAPELTIPRHPPRIADGCNKNHSPNS